MVNMNTFYCCKKMLFCTLYIYKSSPFGLVMIKWVMFFGKDGLTNLKTTWKYTLINTDKFKY